MNSLKRWWTELGQAYVTYYRLQRPWELEGPLRWYQPLVGAPELHGATLPDPEAARR